MLPRAVGEGLLLVAGEERRLRPWDLAYFPPGTDHIVVATGDRPCVVFMAGARETWQEKGGPAARTRSTCPSATSYAKTRSRLAAA